jgi:hypothetical protein
VAIIKYEVPDDLHRLAKAAAAIKGMTLKDYVIAALTKAVEADNPTGAR